MRRFLDASVLVRHLVGTPPDLAQSATALIKSGQPLHVSVLSLMETGYVLEKVAGHPREAVANALLDLVREPFLHLHGLDYHLALQALLRYRQHGGVDLGDTLLWAIARYDGDEVYTFDERFPSDGVTLLTP